MERVTLGLWPFSSGELELEDDWQQYGPLVFYNLPDSSKARRLYIEKAAEEVRSGQLELIFSCTPRTDTEWFHRFWDSGDAVCFWRGRLKFARDGVMAEDASKLPTILMYFGANAHKFCGLFDDSGICINLRLLRKVEMYTDIAKEIAKREVA